MFGCNGDAMTDATSHQVSASRAVSAARVRERARELGFALVGVTPVRGSAHAEFYRSWLGRGLHGSMAYLARADAVERRTRPDAAWPQLRSAIVLAMTYGDEGADADAAATGTEGRGVIARYSLSRDYHRVLKAKLLELLRWIEQESGTRLEAARAYVDTGPVLERELAQRAGLGWFGRNTMLINPGIGSYFFLAALLVEIELEPDAPFTADRCGTCTRCVDACPTGALLGRDENGAPVMDATRCISYLTIEQRGPIPPELRPLIGNRIFGCDICQEVCPYNRKFASPSSEPAFAGRGPDQPVFGVQLERGATLRHPGTRSPSLIALLQTALDPAAWDAFTRGSALRRAGRAGLARNVCVGLGNWGSADAVPVLKSALSDPEPLVRAHAAWALGRVGSNEARAALASRLAVESDESVIAELTTALAGPEPAPSMSHGNRGPGNHT